MIIRIREDEVITITDTKGNKIVTVQNKTDNKSPKDSGWAEPSVLPMAPSDAHNFGLTIH
jgi:hypothetical protein